MSGSRNTLAEAAAMTEVVSVTHEEIARTLDEFRHSPEGKQIAAMQVATRHKVMENRARYSPEELARIDAETERQIAAWSRGDLT
jgi:hypothetical protein